MVKNSPTPEICGAPTFSPFFRRFMISCQIFYLCKESILAVHFGFLFVFLLILFTVFHFAGKDAKLPERLKIGQHGVRTRLAGEIARVVMVMVYM